MPLKITKNHYAIMAETLALSRREAGVSQQEMGRRLGLGQKIISSMETGVRRVDFLELCAIERQLGLKPLTLARRIFVATQKLQRTAK